MKVNDVLFKEAYVLLQAAKTITNELEAVVDLIVKEQVNKKHILITGIGKSYMAASKSAATFNSLNIPAFVIDAYVSHHGDLGMVLPGQILIGLSKSGKTNELISTFNEAGKKGARLVSITCNESSELGKVATKYGGIDVHFKCEMEADFLNIAPTCSSTLLLAIMDSIACVVAYRTGLTKEEFLLNHPAGNLGDLLRSELKK